MRCTLGCFNRPWREFPAEAAFEGIAGAGFDHVGFMAQIGEADDPEDVVAGRTRPALLSEESTDEEIADLLDVLGGYDLTPQMVYGSATRGMVDRAAAAGIPHLLTTDGWSEELPDVADYAEEAGVTIGVKPHGEPLATGRDCADLAERVDSPAFGVSYDPGNVHNYVGGDPTAEIDDVAPHVVSLCVKDHTEADGVAVTPGDGDVDFEAIFGSLEAAGFEGPALVETLGYGDSRLHDDDFGTVEQVNREAARAYDYLTGLVDPV